MRQIRAFAQLKVRWRTTLSDVTEAREDQIDPFVGDLGDGREVLARAARQHDAARRRLVMGLVLVGLSGPCLILALQVWWFAPAAICLAAVGIPLVGLAPAFPAGAYYPICCVFPLPVCCGALLADQAVKAHASVPVIPAMAVLTICANVLTTMWILRRVDEARRRAEGMNVGVADDPRGRVMAGLIQFDVITPGALAWIVGLSVGEVARIVDALDLKGYARRQGRITFGRNTRMVGLTRAGRELLSAP